MTGNKKLTHREGPLAYDSTGRLISKEVLDLTASGDRWLRSLEYDYDLNNNVTYVAYADKQGSNVTQYTYGLDNLLEKTKLSSGKEVTYNYDTFGRMASKELVLDANDSDKKLVNSYTYAASERGTDYTTGKIERETIGDITYKYIYDSYDNITDILKVNADNTETLLCSYSYDDYNQLTVVKDYEHSEQSNYTYNQAGNIIRRYRYQMNSSWAPIDTLENVHYVYGDSEWKDLLTTYNGQTLTYDAIGNPLTYRDGISLTWQNGRELASYSDANNHITYTYDASGMRTSKKVGTSATFNYVYENGLLQKMTRGSRILEFSYDAYGNPVSIKYRSSASATPIYYYYGLNSRGDVVALYSSNGALSVLYTYDAYGKLLSIQTPDGIDITGDTNIAILNPLRYRSYVYDTETGFYYLQSRYYDPTTCRFINADVYCATGQGITGNNMFAYCNNNPVIYSDSTGENLFWDLIDEFYEFFKSSSSAYSVFGGVAALDGFLPFGDIIALAGATTITLFGFGYAIHEATDSSSIADSKSKSKNNDTDQGKKYYHATSFANAQSILSTGKLCGSSFEGNYVYAWKNLPSKYAIKNSGANYAEVIISFKTKAAFTLDPGITNLKVIAFGPVVSVLSGPINVSDVKVVRIIK